MTQANAARKTRLSLTGRRALHGYLFILPFLLSFFFLILSPLILYVAMAFNKITAGAGGGSGITLTPVGWENFENVLFNEQTFLQELIASLQDLLLTGTCTVIFSFFMATVLNQKFRGRGIARAIFFLPVVVASGAAALSQGDALSASAISVITDMSAVNGYSHGFSLPVLLMQLLGDSGASRLGGVVFPLIRQFYTIAMSSGVQILIFLAGLQSVPLSLYEAAHIDGATPWESFWKITFPMMTPMILVCVVYTIVDFMSGMQNSVINTMYEYSTLRSEYGMSSAMGSIYFGIIFLLLGIVVAVVSRFVIYNDR